PSPGAPRRFSSLAPDAIAGIGRTGIDRRCPAIHTRKYHFLDCSGEHHGHLPRTLTVTRPPTDSHPRTRGTPRRLPPRHDNPHAIPPCPVGPRLPGDAGDVGRAREEPGRP